jgi:iron complex outermembrane recepter protein
MNTPLNSVNRNWLSLRAALLGLALFGLGVWTARAQLASGVVEGRASNAETGDFLERVHITIEGTSLETFSDADGYYILSQVPAGAIRLKSFYTGRAPRIDRVTVAPGQTVQHDIQLAPSSKSGMRDGEAVTLDRYVVGESRQMSGAAIAINEQRFASNIVNVVSTDEFGSPVESNVAEFMKFLPGVTIEEIGGVNRRISVDGVPSSNTPVMLDGFSLASAIEGGGGADASQRTVEVDMISLNNLSRVEVSFSPTPESPGDALAGTVNMIPRSAFERSRPIFKVNAYVTMQDNERHLSKTPGPQDRSSNKLRPGVDFSYVAPINKQVGFTLSGSRSTKFAYEPFGQNSWRGGNAATNGAAFPHTTPDKPYLDSYTVRNDSEVTHRDSLGFTLDYKLTPRDRFSLGFQVSLNNIQQNTHTLAFSTVRVASFGFDAVGHAFTRGAAAAGQVQASTGFTDRINRTYMPTLTWRHDGPIWKAVAGAGHSHAVNRFRDIDFGHFGNTVTRLTGVTVAFDDVFYLRPNRISVTDGVTGAPIDPYTLANKTVISGNSQPFDNHVTQQTAYANLARSFSSAVPTTIKAGVDVRHAERDIKHPSGAYSVTGSLAAAPFLSESASQAIPPFGFPATQYPSPALLWAYYQNNPTRFTRDANAEYRNSVSGSKHTNEVISAAYLRGDLGFFGNRLKLVGGVRAEQTNIKAEGPLTDDTLNFQRNASGQIVRNATGVPQTILPTTNALGVSQLTFLERAAHTDKEYLRFFPSINASFNIKENLIARVAYFQSLGRPDNEQYAGGITVPNIANPPSNSNLIRVNNAGIKPWSAESVVVRLEYYFEGVGQLTVGAFRRNLTDAFGGTTFAATPAFLALYNLDRIFTAPTTFAPTRTSPTRFASRASTSVTNRR